MEFLKNNSNEMPKSIEEAVRLLKNSSLGFCSSWSDGHLEDAQKTSEEAFEMLDHIGNELLRRRDDFKKLNKWASSQYKLAMLESIGEIVKLTPPDEEGNFFQTSVGQAEFPAGYIQTNLALEHALNKLKHKVSDGINFNISDTGEHYLFVLTGSGMGQPATISKIHIKTFCNVCKKASLAYKSDES